jgi:nucleotide-binding universal stress UspA family protein
MFKKILVPLDGSKISEKILPKVQELVEFCQAEVTLIRVVVSYKIDPQEEKKEKEMLLKGAQVYLDRLTTRLRKRKLSVNNIIAYGKDAVQICEVARKNKFDLLAMATHSRTGLRRLGVGSVADHVLRCSKVPVMLFQVA